MTASGTSAPDASAPSMSRVGMFLDSVLRAAIMLSIAALALDGARLLAIVVFFSTSEPTSYDVVDTLHGYAILADLALLIVSIPMAAALVTWTSKSYRRAILGGALPPALRFHPLWGWASWLVPMLNLWRPLQVLGDVLRLASASDEDRSSGDWLRRPDPLHLRLWLAWLTGVLVFGGMAAWLFNVRSFEPTLVALQASFEVAGTACLVAAGIALVWVIDTVEYLLAMRFEPQAAAG